MTNETGLLRDLNLKLGDRAPRTIGTLKEIGAKVGDVVESEPGYHTEVCQRHLDSFMRNNYRIISRSAQSPVRTVTKKEIVPGVYGVLRVSGEETDRVYLKVEGCGLSPSELDTLIQHLQDIREAM